MPSSTSRRRPHSLSHGRPKPTSKQSNTIKGTSSSASSRHTRSTIRQHHTLQKRHSAALGVGDVALAESLARQIEEAGGLKAYQQASRTGQSRERGGDASAVLVKWLGERGSVVDDGEKRKGLRMLDVGALTCDTAASRSSLFDEIMRIDLQSQGKGILKQDFMERPLPIGEDEKFDIVSLSLVLNYVPDAKARGEMLRRVERFLRRGPEAGDRVRGTNMGPYLFIVLPAPCVLNSRYMTQGRLEDMLSSLGYAIVQIKTSAKLVYFLCSLVPPPTKSVQQFKKVEIVGGKDRNNFAVVLG